MSIQMYLFSTFNAHRQSNVLAEMHKASINYQELSQNSRTVKKNRQVLNNSVKGNQDHIIF